MAQGDDANQVAVTAAQHYAASTAHFQDPSALIDLQALVRPESAEQVSPLTSIIGPIMGGMMIFFAFFTGGSTAQSILKEDEQGTLARLFTTATRQSTILSGKFMAVGLTLLVQVSLLLAASRLVFNIEWGELAAVVLAAVGLIALATAFGIFLTSLMKSTRQGGAIYGGLITVTGMIGMMTIFTGEGSPAGAVSLVAPQGWAVRGLTLAMNGASLTEVSVNTLVMLALSSLFMAVGVWKFQRRFA
jgi:ABC-2 type transport system permease protein